MARDAPETFSLDAPEVHEFAHVCAMNCTPNNVQFIRNALRISAISVRIHKLPLQIATFIFSVIKLTDLHTSDVCLPSCTKLLDYARRTLALDDCPGVWTPKAGRFALRAFRVMRPGVTSLLINSGFRLDTSLGLAGHPGDAQDVKGHYLETRTEANCPGSEDGAAWAACDVIGATLGSDVSICHSPELSGDASVVELLRSVLVARPSMPWTRPGCRPLDGVLRLLQGGSYPATREFVLTHYQTALRPSGAHTKRAGKRLRLVLNAPDPKRAHAASPELEADKTVESVAATVC